MLSFLQNDWLRLRLQFFYLFCLFLWVVLQCFTMFWNSKCFFFFELNCCSCSITPRIMMMVVVVGAVTVSLQLCIYNIEFECGIVVVALVLACVVFCHFRKNKQTSIRVLRLLGCIKIELNGRVFDGNILLSFFFHIYFIFFPFALDDSAFF